MGRALEMLKRPDELIPLIRMYYATIEASKLPENPELAFCYDILNKVSRSFAVVIQQLPNPLRDAVCVFYLVLRGLDTVEDDMAIPVDVKLPALLKFHESIYDRSFKMDCGEKHYKRLMAGFPTVVEVFLRLDKPLQTVIADITRRMGLGMAKFIQQEVVSVEDYDEYCHYVAGLVGIGLSQLFAMTELEDSSIAESEELSNHMGLFLQKTNIIRDYLEDIMEEPRPRMFWPKAIWGRFGETLDAFKEPTNRKQALECLNAMITDAFRHLPFCIEFMEGLKHPDVFRFCAIPQIMAAGTLALCYNNGKVFEGVVKMRRGETCVIFDSLYNMEDLQRYFLKYLEVMEHKCANEVDVDDPSVKATNEVVANNKEIVVATLEKILSQRSKAQVAIQRWWPMLLLAVVACYAYYAWLGGLEETPMALIPMPQQMLLIGRTELHKIASAILLFLCFSKAATRPATA